MVEGLSLRCGPGSIVRRAVMFNFPPFIEFSQMLVGCWKCLLFILTATTLPIRVYKGFGRGFNPLSLMHLLQILLEEFPY